MTKNKLKVKAGRNGATEKPILKPVTGFVTMAEIENNAEQPRRDLVPTSPSDLQAA
jgi:hypothetical protein